MSRERPNGKCRYDRLRSGCAALIVIASAGCQRSAEPAPWELSGVTRVGGTFLFVAGDVPGFYFEYPVRQEERLVPIDFAQAKAVPYGPPYLGVDIESIDRLVDGRVVLLSERWRALLGPEGVVVEYPGDLTEFGGRGLEGLSVRRLESGASQVAVLWEGGCPDESKLIGSLEGPIPRLDPFALVHDIKAGQAGIQIRYKADPNDRGSIVPSARARLRVSDVVDPRTGARIVLEKTDDFRAPDLVWHKDRERGPILIVLLTLRRRPTPPTTRKYEYFCQLLQRFDLSGSPIGDPHDLRTHMSDDLKQVNWEGLGWNEDGKSLVLCHEGESGPGEVRPSLLIVQLPAAW